MKIDEPTAITQSDATGAVPGDAAPAAPASEMRIKPRPSAVRSTLGIFATRVAIFPVTVLTSVLVARELGPDGRGAYAFMLLLGSFVLPLLSFGFVRQSRTL